MHLWHLAHLLLALSLPLPITAVDITLSPTPPNPDQLPNLANPPVYVGRPNVRPWTGGNVAAYFGATYYQRCSNQPAGVCCKPRSPPPNMPFAMADMFPQPSFGRVTFTGLGPIDLGVAWVPRDNVQACYGRPKATHWGGGTWVYDLPAEDADTKLSGANWIKMPTSLPPKKAESDWLSMEGLAGLVWGKGSSSWFSGPEPGSAASFLAEAQKQLGGGGWSRRRRRRNVNTNIRSADHGVVFCKGPAWAQWADVIVLNGTEFKAEERGSEIYHSGDGDTLNFTGAGN